MDLGDSEKLYYSISEVSELTGVKAHILRFWEKDFSMLRPRKNRAGNRAYRERDIRIVLAIQKLLYGEGYTIKGAQDRMRKDRALVDEIRLEAGAKGREGIQDPEVHASPGVESPTSPPEFAPPSTADSETGGAPAPPSPDRIDPRQVEEVLAGIRRGLGELLRIVEGEC